MTDREKVIKNFADFVISFSKRDNTYYKSLFNSVLALLKEQQPKKGYWKKPKNADARWHECSECGTMTRKVDEYGLTLICNYCPICGADMR